MLSYQNQKQLQLRNLSNWMY